MARPLRLQIKDGWYHVTARGSRRQKFYLDARDRAHFLELLGEIVEMRPLCFLDCRDNRHCADWA